MTKEDLKVEILRCFYGIDWKDLNKVVEPFLEVAERYAQSELSEANKDIEGLHKEVLAYREKVSEQLKEIERLKEQNETLKAGINQCHADYTDQQQEIERLKELLSGMCNNPYYTEKYIEAWDKAKSLITPK